MHFINLSRQQQANGPDKFRLMSQLHPHRHVLNEVGYCQIQRLEFELEFAVLFAQPIDCLLVVSESGCFLVGLGLVLHRGLDVGGYT